MTTLRTRLIAAMADASRTAVTKHNKEQRRLGNYEPGESADGATAELIKMAAALDALAAILDAEGWLLVPVNPTKDMLHRGSDGAQCFGTAMTRTESAYRAMLAASPNPLAQEAEHDRI